VALFLDAIWLPARPQGAKEGVLCVWGISEIGERVLLSVVLGTREAEEDWTVLGRDLTARGLPCPQLVVIDRAPGLDNAVQQCQPDADRRRCTVHYADLRVMPVGVRRWRGRRCARSGGVTRGTPGSCSGLPNFCSASPSTRSGNFNPVAAAADGGALLAPGRNLPLATCVYSVCMARVNVYLPDDLAERVKLAGVSVSAITQDALHDALAAIDTNAWLDHLDRMPAADVQHERVLAAIDDARDEFGARPAT
jgi:post-segregation antitoxin (ccd killing protein)